MLTVRVLPRQGATLRAGFATALVMSASVGAHTWAGGSTPGLAWVSVSALLLFVSGLAVLRGRLSAGVVLPALTLGQFLVHGWLSALAPAGQELTGAHGVGAGHAGHAPLDLGWQMVLAHLAAAALTGLVWHLQRRAVELLVSWSRTPRLPALRRLARPVLTSYVVVSVSLVTAPLRGPPVAAALA